MKKSRISVSSKFIWGAVSLLAVFILWYLGSRLPQFKLLLPNPIDVFKFIGRSFVDPIGSYTLLAHIGWSMSRVMIGYVLACCVG